MPLRLEGATQVRTAFRGLVEGTQREVLEEAALLGAQPIVEAARNLAPVIAKPDPRRSPGLLRRTIQARLFSRKSTEKAVVGIGPVRSGGDDPFFARWVEYGHRIVKRRSKDAGLGRRRHEAKASGESVAPHPFLRPALLSAGTAAAERVRAALLSAINRIWERGR